MNAAMGFITNARDDADGSAVSSTEAIAEPTTHRRRDGYRLTPDQSSSAVAAVTTGDRLTAIDGPVSSGKPDQAALDTMASFVAWYIRGHWHMGIGLHTAPDDLCRHAMGRDTEYFPAASP